MHTRNWMIACGTLLFSALPVVAQPAATPPKPLPEIVSLFNGKDLTGWYTFLKGEGKGKDPKQVFRVEKNHLIISGEEFGCITTEAEYENYYLFAEWRWTGKTFEPRTKNSRDSGILVHSVGEDGGYSGTWMHGIEVQIIEGGTGDFIVVGDGSDNYQITVPAAPERQGDCPVFREGGEPVTLNKGRANWWGRAADWEDVLGFRGAEDVEKPMGEWNHLEVFCKGDTVIVFVNGTKVNEAKNVRPSKGRIQVQSEGAEIEFRKLGLQALDMEDKS